jgi:hypothetical protein
MGLDTNPVTAMAFAVEKKGPDKGQFMGYMRGLQITQKEGHEHSKWKDMFGYINVRKDICRS